jgi:hypothetical protein
MRLVMPSHVGDEVIVEAAGLPAAVQPLLGHAH